MLRGMIRRHWPVLLLFFVFMGLYWSPFFEAVPASFQQFMVKYFFPVTGILVAHGVGITLFPRVNDWDDTDQPYIKIARIALYVTIPICASLGG